jgi:hypothetical protein
MVYPRAAAVDGVAGDDIGCGGGFEFAGARANGCDPTRLDKPDPLCAGSNPIPLNPTR